MFIASQPVMLKLSRLPKIVVTFAMFLINYMETLAFATLGYDAHRGRAKHVSTQTVVALTLSLAPRRLLGCFSRCSKGFSIISCVFSCSAAVGEAQSSPFQMNSHRFRSFIVQKRVK